MTSSNPYHQLPDAAFWRTAVGGRPFAELDGLWAPAPLRTTDKIATAGSCFAQHIGRALRERGAEYLDLEPAPAFLRASGDAERFGYGLFSCRYGNIYSARQLLQLFEDARDERIRDDAVWERGERFYDALRPGVDPAGHASAEAVIALRSRHLAAVQAMAKSLDWFIFTLGLTEAWVSREDGTVYPTAPGTLAGTYDPARHAFVNFSYGDVFEDLCRFRELLLAVNPAARIILTVSPVPLAATASGEHVLTANTHSKSVLRAVAGSLAQAFDDVFYFPSYEIITSHRNNGYFFNPDGRTVNKDGVEAVMRHFFASPAPDDSAKEDGGQADVMCDEGDVAEFVLSDRKS